MKYFLVLLTFLSFKAFSQETAPPDLLSILDEFQVSACVINKDTKELCDCQKAEHKVAGHACMVAKCCAEDNVQVGANSGVSCEKTVQGSYKEALQKAKDNNVETGVTDY